MNNANKTPEEVLNESNRINNMNQRVHDMGDATISVSMSVYELLKQNGYDLSSNFGPLYDYCKKKNNDMIVINRDVKALVSYEDDLSKKEASTKNFYDAMFNQYKTGYLDMVEDLITNDPEFSDKSNAPSEFQYKSGKNEFVVRMNEIKYLLGIDVYNSEDYSDKLKKAKKNLSDNYERFRNLTPDEVQTKGAALRNSIEQNRYYISQLERRMEAANSLGVPKNAINSPEQVNELMSKLKYLSNSYVNSIELTKETRIKLIEIFDRIRMLVADYRNYVLNYNTIERKYNKLISEMGVVKASAKTKSKEKLDSETDIDNGFAPLPGTKTMPSEKSSEKPQEKPSETKPKEEEPNFSEEELFHVGDIVIYNGKRESRKDIGAPKGLEIGKEYKVNNIVYINGLVYLALDGVRDVVDSAVFEKLVKGKENPVEEKPEEKSKPADTPTEAEPKEPEKEEPEPKEKPQEEPQEKPSDEEEKDITKGHDYKLASSTFAKLAPVWRLAAVLGVALTAGITPFFIGGGWLVLEGIKKIVDSKSRDIISVRKVKEKITEKANKVREAAAKGDSTVTEQDAKDAADLVAELNNSLPTEPELEQSEQEKTNENKEKKPAEQSQEDLEADDLAREIQANLENTLKPAGDLPKIKTM
ncbi:MAG: hypothetical protein Q4C44_01430 [bacterium]|nr:hypothetical protein [bacterium]